ILSHVETAILVIVVIPVNQVTCAAQPVPLYVEADAVTKVASLVMYAAHTVLLHVEIVMEGAVR
ncbi:8992_t:CDS:1, partial [Cetraspora pellucida]